MKSVRTRSQAIPVVLALVWISTPGCSTSSAPGAAAAPPDNGAAGAPAASDASCARNEACAEPDPHAELRRACTFGAGARVADTLGDVSALRSAIDHVIVVVHENHSLDNLFGKTGHGIEGLPADATNLDDGGHAVPAFHLSRLCTADLAHAFEDMHGEYDGGKMDGFVRVAGTDAMGYYTDADHPFYTSLATTFAFTDHAFASVLGPTWPNRDYLFAATSDGIEETSGGALTAPNLFDSLDGAGIAWADYNNGANPPFQTDLGIGLERPEIKAFGELAPALASGVLEPFVYVDSGEDTADEHPGMDGIDHGERFMAALLARVFASPLWPHLALIFSYDESGGYYDHVTPPPACLAAPSEVDFDRLGFRVPLLVVSPFARAGYVSHEVHSLTSITRFVEALFDLPALTARDANSDGLLDLFDFSSPAFENPPTDLPAPNGLTSICP
jgi:phospholipase C